MICKRCNVEMTEGLYLKMVYKGRINPGATYTWCDLKFKELDKCLKCHECGYSVTI